VKKYDAPTFSFNIDLPETVSARDKGFTVTIDPLSTFEEFKGEVFMKFYTQGWRDVNVFRPFPELEPEPEPLPLPDPLPEPLLEPEPEPELIYDENLRQKRSGLFTKEYRYVVNTLLTKIIEINSKTVTFDVELSPSQAFLPNVYVDAVFTEDSTKKTLSTSRMFNFARYELLIISSDYYEPEKTFNFQVSMRKIGSGTSVSSNHYMVKCNDRVIKFDNKLIFYLTNLTNLFSFKPKYRVNVLVEVTEGSSNCFYPSCENYKFKKFKVITDWDGSIDLSVLPGKADNIRIYVSQ
jgi:hypothetical protein